MPDGNLAVNQRGRPFKIGESGNPTGRPRGARNRATLAVEALLDDEAEALTRKVIEMAIGGDMNAIRLCLDRILPPRREQSIELELPKPKSIYDVPDVMAAIITGAANGDIPPSAAAELLKLVEVYFRTCVSLNRETRRPGDFAGLSDAELEDRLVATLTGRGMSEEVARQFVARQPRKGGMHGPGKPDA